MRRLARRRRDTTCTVHGSRFGVTCTACEPPTSTRRISPPPADRAAFLDGAATLIDLASTQDPAVEDPARRAREARATAALYRDLAADDDVLCLELT